MIALIIWGGKEKGFKNCYEAKLSNFWTLTANTGKQFCKAFKCFVKKWIDYNHWDTKYCTEIFNLLKEICFILNELFRKLPQRVSHCCLSVFNCLSFVMALIDWLILFYFAWIWNDFCEMYEGDIKTIFNKYELNEKVKFISNAIKMKNEAK